MDPAKAAKIKKRTLVGASLAAGVAALLWLAGVDTSHTLVPLFGLLMAGGGALELARMGTFGGRGWSMPLIAGLVAAAFVQWAVLLGDATGPSAPTDALARWWLGWVVVGGVAAVFLPLRRLPGGPGNVVHWIVAALGVFGLIAFLAGSADTSEAVWRLVAVAAGALVIELALRRLRPRDGDASLGRALSPIALALWVIPALPALTYVDRWLGVAGLGALLLLSKVGDVFGYYVGSAIGKSHPFPKLSPGKTTEGCVGSLVAGCAFGAACVWWGLLPGEPHGSLGGVLAGGVVNLASQAGDLLESKAKRTAGVKDSGTLFGPSGGFLDLTDSLLLSVPVALAVWPLLFDVVAG